MKLRVKILPAAVAGTLAASMYGPAFAQAPAAAAKADDKVDRIEVTGSLIKRVEGEAALPVTVISIDELLKAGVTNAEQAVKLIAQQQGGTVTSASVSGTNGAASYANLRALGAQRTLVLLNGKRIVSNPFSSVAVDLNTLPLAAVQRIEVLSDGASATYGTDAIAGVINFITHKDFRGGTISAEAQVPKDKGGEQYKADILAGMGNMAKQGWNVNVAFSYRENKPRFGTDRDFSRSAFIPEYGLNALSPTTFPANYTQGSLVTNPSIPTCAPPTSIYTPQGNGVGLGTTRCGADTQAFTWTIPDQKQWNGSIRGTLGLLYDYPTGRLDTLEVSSTKLPTDGWIPYEVTTRWFPDAFIGTMGSLLGAIAGKNQLRSSVQENLGTLKLIAALYESIKTNQVVKL
jgi:iron complex outermembrane receptor protein